MPEHEPLTEGREVLALPSSSPTQRPLSCPKQACPRVPTRSLASVASKAFANCSGQNTPFPAFIIFRISKSRAVYYYLLSRVSGQTNQKQVGVFLPVLVLPFFALLYFRTPLNLRRKRHTDSPLRVHPPLSYAGLIRCLVCLKIQKGKKPGRDHAFPPNVFSC